MVSKTSLTTSCNWQHASKHSSHKTTSSVLAVVSKSHTSCAHEKASLGCSSVQTPPVDAGVAAGVAAGVDGGVAGRVAAGVAGGVGAGVA